jgi:type II secretory pathway pseudopilin PulG
MSTTAIVIVVVAVVVVALAVTVLPTMSRNRATARVHDKRQAAASRHREAAEDRRALVRLAEREAAADRAQATLHEARADLIDRGLADEDLDQPRERSGRLERDQPADPGDPPATAPPDGDPAPSAAAGPANPDPYMRESRR